MTRRTLLASAAALALPTGSGEGRAKRGLNRFERLGAEGRLTARPSSAGVPRPAAAGVRPLGLDHGRDGLLFVPTGYRPERPAPLAVVLHGAGGDARGGLAAFLELAEGAGLLLLAPESRGRTWDVVLGRFGGDVAFLEGALERVFCDYAVDPGRVAVGGFSDGASYALSLGLRNGELFGAVMAFSPGFVRAGKRQGDPRVFIAHGTRDTVLPIDRCSRRIVPALREAGYDVRYGEFDGGHTVPAEIARGALSWLLE